MAATRRRVRCVRGAPGCDISALEIPIPISTQVIRLLTARHCDPAVLAHPDSPEHHVILTGEKFSTALPWSPGVHHITDTLTLPPTTTAHAADHLATTPAPRLPAPVPGNRRLRCAARHTRRLPPVTTRRPPPPTTKAGCGPAGLLDHDLPQPREILQPLLAAKLTEMRLRRSATRAETPSERRGLPTHHQRSTGLAGGYLTYVGAIPVDQLTHRHRPRRRGRPRSGAPIRTRCRNQRTSRNVSIRWVSSS